MENSAGENSYALRLNQRGAKDRRTLLKIIPAREGANRNQENPDYDKGHRHSVYVDGCARRGTGSHKQKNAYECSEAAPDL